jgi:hypothetical protein
MQQFPPFPPAKKDEVRPTRRTPDPNASLFSTGPYPVVGNPADSSRRNERGARILSDVKRGLLFAGVLVLVAVVLYIFVSATLLR